MGKVWFGILVVAGCGRLGFDPGETRAPDAPQPGDVPVENTHVLACGAPVRFASGGGLTALAAAPTAAGFVIAAIDGAKELAGWSYAWHDDVLAPTAERVALGSDTRTVGATSVRDDVVVASVFGAAAPQGTTLYPLGGALARRGPAVARGEIAGDAPLAASGVASELAFLTVDPTTAQVDLRGLTTLGEATGAARKVVDAAEMASSVTLSTAGTGYLATWISRASSPNTSRVALLDPTFGIAAGPVTTNTTTFDATRAQAVWAGSAGRYLVTWFEKNAGGGDDVWYQLRGPNLEQITAAALLVPNAHSPATVSNGTTFWVAYVDADSQRLAGVKVDADGTFTSRPVENSGGTPGPWGFVTRAGQSVLVWAEQAGSGPDLYLDPLCP